MVRQYSYLTPEDEDHFLRYGYIVVRGAFTKEKAAEWTRTMWIRLGLDPNDKTTWTKERIHMPWHRREAVSDFAPKAWEAMKDLLGGADRIDVDKSTWGDSFIINFGTPELEQLEQDTPPQDLDNWHVDGDFFLHFLDSPEQALLVIPVFSSIKPRSGGSFISPDGLTAVAKYLATHPEGVLPTGLSFWPYNGGSEDQYTAERCWSHLDEIKYCNQFIELTEEVGDVILMHPLMMHTASKNYTRGLRVITNPPAALKEPFCFDRENPEEYSLVERKTLAALGVDRLKGWKITSERMTIVPERIHREGEVIEVERRRLMAAGIDVPSRFVTRGT
ncbi:hypothetical protein AX16_005655 [Volvariella volvacea WC 439]|nr:hypothetical protein AX16_005655 [Volvariella volvacea WC 439]